MMKIQKRTRLYTTEWQTDSGDYVLGTYYFYVVAWLRGFCHVMVQPNRSVYLDRYLVAIVEKP